jgi:hypothetical protein
MFDHPAHARPGDTTSAEDLDGILRGLLCRPRDGSLQKSNWASQQIGLLFIGLELGVMNTLSKGPEEVTTDHVAHLVRDRLYILVSAEMNKMHDKVKLPSQA